ncbi:MAG: biotin--[acetyl-CoA-carboxylase] ligase [Anaerolineae bacterium]
MQSDVLTREAIESQLTTKWLGRPVTVFDAIPSTNNWLSEQAAQGAAQGALAVADVQTAGRGRMGRTWQSPPGAGLLFSLLFRPPANVTPGQVGLVAAAGAAVGIAKHLGVDTRLKWPNDVLVNGKKVAGMLGDASFRDGRAEWVVVGIGLNVNLAPADFPSPPPGGVEPTSLLAELGNPIERARLLAAILAAIEPRYEALVAGEPQAEEWRRLSATLGQPVRITGGVAVEGVAQDIADDGSLLVKQDDGSVVSVAAGDVTLRQS